ncbi:MAG: hypothetical protein ACO239_05865 [Sediminibacterium sp.]
MKINLGAKVKRKTYRANWTNGKPKNVRIKSITANHSASGQLVNSIKVVTLPNGLYGVQMNDYGIYVNNGRQPGKGIPVEQMDKWISQKRLRPRDTKTGEFLKNTKNNRKAMAFCMNRKIKYFGIEAYPFIDRSVETAVDKYQDKLSKALGDDFYKYIGIALKKAKRK